MKAVNIILSILILLLSAAAAVFSYFLFEKRSQFVTGWAKMARVISESSSALDQGSGTQIASKLTTAALAHENYAKLDSLIQELPTQSRNIIKERDTLANALQSVSGMVGMGVVAKDKLSGIDTYYQAQNMVVAGVKRAIDNRDATYRNLIAVVQREFRVNIDRKLLLAGNRKAFDELARKLSANRNQVAFYNNFVVNAGRTFGANLRGGLNESNYRAQIGVVNNAINVYRNNFNQTKSKLNKALRDIASRDRTIGSLNNRIKGLNAVVADRDQQISSFQRAFGLSDVRDGAKPWKPGSAEARAALVGKVTAVNTKYGYIAIDVGKYSVVQQTIGNRTLEINPDLQPGLAMIVTRKGLRESEFISRILLSQVGETNSIANIPVDSKTIHVGDIVTVAVDEKAPVKAAAKPAQKSAKR